MFTHRIATRIGQLVLTAILTIPVTSQAQPVSGRGFMFGKPNGSFSFRLGVASPLANSDIYDFTREQLTVGRGDFVAFNMAADFSQLVTDRVAVQLGAGYSGRSVDSHVREYVDNNDMEIEQNTYMQRIPISLGLRYYLAPPGRQLGRLAWVPNKFVPYVSAGGGTMWYRFRQKGDFVDYETLDVFRSELESSSWAPSAYGAVGAEFATGAMMGFITEARYDASRAKMSGDFADFDKINLSGFSASVGLTFRF